MTPAQLRKRDRELTGFLDSMTVGMGRTERRRALGGYLTSLLLDGERKSIRPMAARLVEEPDQTEAMRQRRTAGVPPEVDFKRKWELAIEQLDEALGWGVRHHVVLADPGYGNCREFCEALRAQELHFLMGVQGNANVGHPDSTPQAPQRALHPMGRPRTPFRWSGQLQARSHGS